MLGIQQYRIIMVPAHTDLTTRKREFVKRKLHYKNDGFHQRDEGAMPKKRKRCLNLAVRVRKCFIEEAS